MSDKDDAPKAPKAIVEQVGADGGEAPFEPGKAEDVEPSSHGFHKATIGFFEGLGRAAWAYADTHPHATLYGIVGFVLAVLVLSIGLWDTIVIAVFVSVGTIIGQTIDGDNAAVNFIRRLLDGRK